MGPPTLNRTGSTHAKTLPSPPLPDAGASWALFLDVDGTLLGFADNPEHVRVPRELATTLGALHHALDGAMALVSGRSLADLDRLFAEPGWAATGLHGLQRRRADGTRSEFQANAAELAELHRGAATLAARLPGVRLEDKGACIALHCREAPQHAAALAAGAKQLAQTLDDYEVQPGNHVYELKPTRVDKGQALVTFLAEAPFVGRTPVYLGDDHTDEHAFNAVNTRDGISVRVGHRQPSKARFMLGNPAAVQNWLDAVLARLT